MTDIKKIKLAIVHDAFIEDGGSESVVLKLSDMFPEADIYTSLINPDSQTFQKLKPKIIKSFLTTSFIKGNPSYLKPLINVYWQGLDFSGYDLVISSSGSFSAKSIITKPTTIHICYCHTPPRFLYREFSETDNKRAKYFKDILYFFLRQSDFIAAQRPDIMIANSETVAARINKYYRLNSYVIYPPVKIPDVPPARKTVKEYYVYIGRLYKQKGVTLLIEAFNKVGKKLIVVGTGSELENLKSEAGKNIVFKGYLKESVKNRLLSEAKGLVFPSIDEDFGMVPVEAMARGVPVIAYFSGGVRETVIDGKTGIFFNGYSLRSLQEAIGKFEKTKFKPLDCYKQAKKFSEKEFEKKLLNLISKVVDKKT